MRLNWDEQAQTEIPDQPVFPFGSWLRRRSLDELPQFINVLCGDMSISGPRPFLVGQDQTFAKRIPNYDRRRGVKPGITGLAQCFGLRGKITCEEDLFQRIEADLFYVSHWSIGLDCVIFWRTLIQILFPPPTAV
jgi:putative colanic acid biosynthesis UDP-glucose lipid carrier transferase